ncbi:MAG: endonuclease/exonuclease/phosphatase family protein [Candidatus Competibacteraceae bacterium]|nr:endonuclease/exonuclease/phosphatase family protein [Candidatus Competibacteraceae bacterium]
MLSIFRVTFQGLITAAAALTCIVTLLGFLGRCWWGFELATHFRVQYTLALGLAALALLGWRRLRWAAICAVFALVNTAIIAPRFLPPTVASATDGGPVLRVLLANVNSANRDHQRIRDTITVYNPDFVVLLEVTSWLLARLAVLHGDYPYRVAAPREDNFGIAFLSRQPFARADIVQLSAAGLPSIIAEFADGQRRYTLLGTHPLPPMGSAQARDRNEQLIQLAHLARQSQQPFLLLGDLNISPWSPYFSQLLADSGLRDSGKGRGILPTWPVGWPPLWIPIDHALSSVGILIQDRATGSDLGSDHYPVIVDFQIVRP